jgi:hypothetical protein
VPILHANLETDLRLANVLSQEIALLLADRTSIRTTGAITYFGSVNGAGSDTVNVRLAGLDGFEAMSATAAEDTDVAETALTDASATIAVARYSLRRDLGDLAELSGFGGGDITVQRLAASAVGEADKAFMGIVATAVAGFGSDVGSSGVDMSVDDFFSGISTLELTSNSGPFYALLHPQQLSDLQTSARAEAGALQFMVAGADDPILKVKGSGYVGSFLGVDVYTSSEITSAGGNRHGAMWAQGALGWADAVPMIGYGQTVRPAGSSVTVEIQRDASKALTEIVSHAYMGCSIVQDTMGVGIVTDN